MAHTSFLGLLLDLVAANRTLATRKGARAITALDGAGRLIGFTIENLEAHPPGFGHKPNAVTHSRQSPIRRQGYNAAAIRTRDRPGPEICFVSWRPKKIGYPRS